MLRLGSFIRKGRILCKATLLFFAGTDDDDGDSYDELDVVFLRDGFVRHRRSDEDEEHITAKWRHGQVVTAGALSYRAEVMARSDETTERAAKKRRTCPSPRRASNGRITGLGQTARAGGTNVVRFVTPGNETEEAGYVGAPYVRRVGAEISDVHEGSLMTYFTSSGHAGNTVAAPELSPTRRVHGSCRRSGAASGDGPIVGASTEHSDTLDCRREGLRTSQ